MNTDTTPMDEDRTDDESVDRTLAAEEETLALFASVVSHDLSNPLELGRVHRDAAQQTLSALRSDLDDADLDADLDALETHLEKIATAQDRMRDLLSDARSLTRHGSPDDPEPVSLAETAQAAWDTLSSPEANLEVDGDYRLEADETGLRQLLENCYRNALDHAGSEATVRVGPLESATAHDDADASHGETDTPFGFYVADDGPGIPEYERDEVFDLGYTTAEDGTGFGLAIVEEIAARHDWSIDVTESTDGGARFELHVE